jgi:putative membrane protein
MIVREDVPFLFFRLLSWQRRAVLIQLLGATAVVVAAKLYDLSFLYITSVPLTVIGAALAIFVGFRTNSAYDKWWEGRKLWGRMVNVSRLLTFQVETYMRVEGEHEAEVDALREDILRVHAAYVHSLRVGLRVQAPDEDADLLRLLTDEERAAHKDTLNLPLALLHSQSPRIRRAVELGALDAFQLQSIDATVTELLGIQGGCERIKKTPIPRIYAGVANILVKWLIVLLPLGLVKDIGWLAIPISSLGTLAFHLVNETGRILDDPFNMFFNTLPLTQLSRMIESNMLEQRGVYEHPEIPGPVDGVLY